MRSSGSSKAYIRSYLVVIVAVVFFAQQSLPPSLAQTNNPQAGSVPNLKIVVLEGEDGVNIIKKKTAVKPVVEVRDKNNLPVAGAYVTFLVPGNGPGVIFPDGSRTMSILTDSNGRAAVPSMKPVGQGAFEIRVTATFQDLVAKAVIAQTNYLTVAAAGAAGAGAGGAGGGLSGAAIAGIIAGVAAAVAVAVAVGKGGGGSRTTTGSIGGAGTPTIGPPH